MSVFNVHSLQYHNTSNVFLYFILLFMLKADVLKSVHAALSHTMKMDGD